MNFAFQTLYTKLRAHHQIQKARDVLTVFKTLSKQTLVQKKKGEIRQSWVKLAPTDAFCCPWIQPRTTTQSRAVS